MTDKNVNTEIYKEFCPNCEAETPCTHEAELFVCDICGEDFAKYIVSRNCNVSDVSMTRDVTTPEPHIRGGDGSHWEGCEEVHWDCKIAKLEKEIERLAERLHDEIGQTELANDAANRWRDTALQLSTYCGEARAELVRRDERIAELEAMINPASFDKYLVSKLKDPQLAEDYAKVIVKDKTLKRIIEKQKEAIDSLKKDNTILAEKVEVYNELREKEAWENIRLLEIIEKLKEDGERLAKI